MAGETFKGDITGAFAGLSPTIPLWRLHELGYGDELEGYKGSSDPFEQALYRASQASQGQYEPTPEYAAMSSEERQAYHDKWGAYAVTSQPITAPSFDELLTHMVVNPMGYSPEETGNYTWGNLAYIYQTTPSGDIARQLQTWRASGQNLKADVMEASYGATRRPEQGLDVIRRLTSKYGHGQTDVAMNPELVGQMLSRRTTDRSQRQYRGGSVHAGLLTSPALGFKRQLGG